TPLVLERRKSDSAGVGPPPDAERMGAAEGSIGRSRQPICHNSAAASASRTGEARPLVGWTCRAPWRYLARPVGSSKLTEIHGVGSCGGPGRVRVVPAPSGATVAA